MENKYYTQDNSGYAYTGNRDMLGRKKDHVRQEVGSRKGGSRIM